MHVDQKKIIRELKKLLTKNFNDNIADVILYGSQLKGTATEHSDFDVIIVLRDEYDWKTKREINDLL